MIMRATDRFRRSAGRPPRSTGWLHPFAGLLLLAAGSFPGTPAGAFSVDPRHPRILIYADSLPAIQARCSSVNAAHFQAWLQIYDARRNHPNFAAYWVDDMAAVYALTGDTRFSDVAIREAMKKVRAGGESQSGMGRLNEVVLTYDWCYDRLTAAQRDSIVNYCVSLLATIPEHDAHYRSRDLRWHYALAIYGEAGGQNGFVHDKLQACIDLEEDWVLPCLDEISGGGSSGYYSGVYFSNHMNFIDGLRHSIGYAGPALESAWFAASPAFWMHRLRPDWQWMRTTGRYNMSEASPFAYFAYFGSRQGDRRAQHLANLQASLDTDASGFLPVMIWYDPMRPSLPVTDLGLAFADEEYGYFFWRSGWTLGPTSNDVQVAFYNGPDVEPDHERTQNSFTVTRGNDDLLISAGRFYDSSDQHYRDYARRAVSRNTVLIYDSAESFGSGVPNDGGQTDSDFTQGNTRWPHCGNGVGYRGFAELLPAGNDLLFGVRGHANRAYSSTKARAVCRELRIPRANWIILTDHLELVRQGLPVRLVFHSIEKPMVDGTLTTVEGGPNGGVYRSRDTRVITITRGDSRCRIYPAYASGGGVEVRLVGGFSPSNLPWRQSVKPSTAITYVANQGYQAYECWVDGMNRSPTHGSLTQAQIDARNVEPHACGDWRVEILITDTGSAVDAVTAIEVGSTALPLRTVTAADEGDRIRLAVSGGGDPFWLHLPRVACVD